MPTPTYVAIAKTVLTGTQATITFSGIPSTYTDLLLSISARTDSANAYDILVFQFNGDTATNYSMTRLYGDGSTTGSNRASSVVTMNTYRTITGAGATSNTFGSVEMYIPNYTSTSARPVSFTGASETNAATGIYISADAGLYRGTSAISSIVITPSTGPNFVSGSRFDLYGIKNS